LQKQARQSLEESYDSLMNQQPTKIKYSNLKHQSLKVSMRRDGILLEPLSWPSAQKEPWTVTLHHFDGSLIDVMVWPGKQALFWSTKMSSSRLGIYVLKLENTKA
jgi:hypothetical protein